MEDEPPLSQSLVLAGSVLGLVPALMLNLLAFLMAGGGHGWCTPIGPSFAALLAFPALGVLVSMPPSREKLPWSFGLVVAAAAADLYLISGTRVEGVEYFQRVIAQGLPAVVGWFVLWGGAQVMAVVGCVRALIASSQKRPD